MARLYDRLSLNKGGQSLGKVVIMAKTATKRVGYKGPRVTAAILRMDEAGRKGWLDGLKVSDAERAKISERLTKALTKPIKSKKFSIESFTAMAGKLEVSDLVEIQKVISPLIASGKDAEKARIKAELEKLQAAAAALEG